VTITIIQRITTDREIDAAAAVVDPNDIVAIPLGKIDRGLSPVTLI
jgi:hypothetical protein